MEQSPPAATGGLFRWDQSSMIGSIARMVSAASFHRNPRSRHPPRPSSRGRAARKRRCALRRDPPHHRRRCRSAFACRSSCRSRGCRRRPPPRPGSAAPPRWQAGSASIATRASASWPRLRPCHPFPPPPALPPSPASAAGRAPSPNWDRAAAEVRTWAPDAPRHSRDERRHSLHSPVKTPVRAMTRSKPAIFFSREGPGCDSAKARTSRASNRRTAPRAVQPWCRQAVRHP